LLIAAGCVAVGALLMYLLLQKMTRPLNRLFEGVKALESGKPAQPVEVVACDEIGRVSLAFNHMAETLERRNRENRRLQEKLREAQRAEAREEWERTFDALPDMVAVLDPEHRIVRINRSMASRLATAKEKAVGCTPAALRSGIDTRNLAAAGGTGELPFSGEIYSAPLEAHFEVTLSPLMKEGEEAGFVFVARDITRRKRYEEEQKLLQAKLVQTNKMTSLGQLVTGIAHEINNPNNSVMLGSQLLSSVWRDALPILERCHREEGEFYLGGVSYSEARETISRQILRITESSRRIDGVIRNLRDFAVGKESFVSGVSLNRVVNFSLSILNNQIKKHVGGLELQLAEDLPPVRGNPQQLEQVVINLLMNAIQSLPDAGRRIFVSTSYEAAEKTVSVVVRDQGEGIPPEVMERLFEPFFSTKLEKGGSGLGLSISKLIVTEHRGELVIRSAPGEGTTASVRLPVAGGAEAAVINSSFRFQ
ncbi:MAG TPA: ATP-binding protein, partial [Verrucomicrobiae bacterium]|nr:ATP-binding protein [Verrucomicrobiae bacterium]